jgi:hypothetical protein
MDPVWLQFVISLATAGVVASGFVWAIKGDTKVLKTRLDTIDNQLAKMDNVLVTLAENKGRMDLLGAQLVMTGQRLDDLQRKVYSKAN